MSCNAPRASALLLLLLLSSATAQRYCQVGGSVAHCTDLLFFPQLPHSITELNILCSERFRSQMQCAPTRALPRIERNWMQRYQRLETIKIENCPYHDFPESAFANLKRLRTLVLHNISLSRLSSDALRNSYNLETLRLEYLPCMQIDYSLLDRQTRLKEIVLTHTRLSGIVVRHLISSVKRTLAYFSWSKNMVPVSLPIRTFSGFYSLNELDLSKNRLTDSMDFLDQTSARKLILEGNPKAYPLGSLDFSSYKHMRNTEYLDLRAMKLRSLPSNAFRPLVNLRTLLLGKNLLTFVSRPLIIHMPRLMTLDLSENRLRSVPQEIEYLLHRKQNGAKFKLDLKGNPLHCNCEVAWLLKYTNKERNDDDMYGDRIYGANPYKDKFYNDNPYDSLKCNTGINPRLNQKRLSEVRLSDLRCKTAAPPVVDIELYGAVKINDPSRLFPNVHQGEVLQRRTLTQNGNVELDAGQSLRLVCRSQGDPSPLMMWQVLNGSSVQREAPRDRLDRYNEIELRFSQRQLRYDRYIIVCWAMSPKDMYNINVTIYNKAAKEILPTFPPRRPPADIAAPPPHQRRHERGQKRGHQRGRIRIEGVTPRAPLGPNFMRSNRTNAAVYEPREAGFGVRLLPAGALVVLTATVTLAVHR